MMHFSKLVTIAAIFLASVAAIPTISIKGAKFFTSDGNQFYIKGQQSNQYGRMAF